MNVLGNCHPHSWADDVNATQQRVTPEKTTGRQLVVHLRVIDRIVASHQVPLPYLLHRESIYGPALDAASGAYPGALACLQR